MSFFKYYFHNSYSKVRSPIPLLYVTIKNYLIIVWPIGTLRLDWPTGTLGLDWPTGIRGLDWPIAVK